MIEEQNLPPLFDKRGKWLGYDAATFEQLSPQRRELYDRLADAVVNVLVPREAAQKDARDRIASIVAEIREVEAAKPKPMTQVELAKQWIASQRTRHVNQQ